MEKKRHPPYESNDSLDQRPSRRRIEQLDNHRDAVIEPHRVLRHLGLDVARREVAQRAHRRLGYLLALARVDDRADQRVHAAHLAHGHLVALVVAGQVGQDAGRAGHDVHVGRSQDLHERLEQALQTVHLEFISKHPYALSNIFIMPTFTHHTQRNKSKLQIMIYEKKPIRVLFLMGVINNEEKKKNTTRFWYNSILVDSP